jgi:hypothetical protein
MADGLFPTSDENLPQGNSEGYSTPQLHLQYRKTWSVLGKEHLHKRWLRSQFNRR